MAQVQALSAIELLDRLIAFDTVSARSNLGLIEFVASYLAGHGVTARLSHAPDGGKANLLATIGPAEVPGAVLAGHSDVVPVEGQAWTTEPFRLTRRDGRLYGRGSADMKGFIAALLALVPAMRAAPLRRPLHLAFTYDEEVGCTGVHHLLHQIEHELPRPLLAVIGEPTNLRVVNAHKGVYLFETTVVGLEGHSSATQRGANAIYAAADIVRFLSGVAAAKEAQPAAAGEAARFVPPYTTVNVGVIGGGTAVNIIPNRCSLIWEFRLLPGDDPADIPQRLDAHVEREVLPRLRRTFAGASVETRATVVVPPLVPEADSPAETLALRLTETNRAEVVAFGSEGGIFQQAGIPTVLCGPGDIAQAHQPDEYLAERDLAACTEFLRRVIAWAAQ